MDEEEILLSDESMPKNVIADPIELPSEMLSDDSLPKMDPIEIISSDKIADVNLLGARNQMKFKKRLIAQVRTHRVLYDTSHKRFSNVAVKELAWEKISKRLKINVDECKNTWTDLRWQYQKYVRRLRLFISTGNKNRKPRPIMALETDMIFLWRFVADKSRCALPFAVEKAEISSNVTVTLADDDDDDVVMLEDEAPVVIIDLDDDDNEKESTTKPREFLVTDNSRKLSDLISMYQELYDSDNRYYNDFKRKGIIWNAIANEIGDKATKLMKYWIYMQARYEWEINNANYNPTKDKTSATNCEEKTELQKVLKFLKPYILKNPNTIYKQSYYLKQDWQEPIEYFKNIYNLLALMKKNPQIINISDQVVKSVQKGELYILFWEDIAKMRGNLPGECESTWLILRQFYWELMNMRKTSYMLQDKWYFESIITELYKTADSVKPKVVLNNSIAAKSSVQTVTPATSISSGSPAPSSPSLCPISVNLDEDSISASRIETNHTNPPPAPPAPKQIISQAISTKQTTTTTTATKAKITPAAPLILNGITNRSIKMPKITSAKSLAPHMPTVGSTGRGLKITPIGQMLVSPSAGTILPPTTTANYAAATATSPPPLSAVPVPVQLPYTLPKHTKVTALTMPSLSLINPTTAAPSPPPPALARITTVPITKMQRMGGLTPTSIVATTTALPKITGALSLLSPNEIMIELIGSANGNMLVVHGPPLSEKYALSMSKTASFIREIMAIPLLHNKTHHNPAQITNYWQYLSQKFELPTHICKACWNFLSENFSHFPQIAPMEALMKPFQSKIKVWTKSDELFSKFNSNAVKMGWLHYKNLLPQLMEEIGKYPFLYKDLGVAKPVFSNFEMSTVWKQIRLQFPLINQVIEIWTAFKNIFWSYMCDLERGIDNDWPMNWWKVLEKLKFLMEQRYHNMEPFYYIVRNKINEEIERCAFQDMCIELPQLKNVEIIPEPEPEAAMEVVSYGRLDPPINVGTETIIDSPIDTPIVSPINTPPGTNTPDLLCDEIIAPQVQHRPELDAYSLTMAIRRHPHIYQKCQSWEKVKAWEKLAEELGTTVTVCRLTFQRALKNYRLFLARDTVKRCRISQKYYKHMNEIYRDVWPVRTTLNIKTPVELNQSVDDGNAECYFTESIFPDRFIPDITMDNSKPALVMKNWSYAIGNLSGLTQDYMLIKLIKLFKRYTNNK